MTPAIPADFRLQSPPLTADRAQPWLAPALSDTDAYFVWKRDVLKIEELTPVAKAAWDAACLRARLSLTVLRAIPPGGSVTDPDDCI